MVQVAECLTGCFTKKPQTNKHTHTTQKTKPVGESRNPLCFSPVSFCLSPAVITVMDFVWLCILSMFFYFCLCLCSYTIYGLIVYFVMLTFCLCFIHSVVYTLFFFSFCFQWKKAEEKLERELREAEASESTEKKLKLVGDFTFGYTFKMLSEYNFKFIVSTF
jgi:uncharacterized membrane protein